MSKGTLFYIRNLVNLHIKTLQFSQKKHNGVYLAIIQEDEYFSLDLEVSETEIAFSVFDVSQNEIKEYSTNIKLALKENGINLYESYDKWEKALE